MKLKLTILIGLILVMAAALIVLIRQQPRRSVEDELPAAMSNYQKTFKLDTSPAIFPDGNATNLSSKTNALKP